MPDFEKLDTYLLSDEAHHDRVRLSVFDGFLTRIACSPEEAPKKSGSAGAFDDFLAVALFGSRCLPHLHSWVVMMCQKPSPIKSP